MLADISIETVLGMPFLSLNNVNLQFGIRKLTWKMYTTAKAILTTRQVKLINIHKFAKAALDKVSKIFVLHVTALEISSDMKIYTFRAAQISQKIIQPATLQ